MAIRITLSRKLGELRWTQDKLAKRTGICKNTIGNYYNEITDRINLEHFDLICEALDCDLSEILHFERNKIPKLTCVEQNSDKTK